MTKCQNCGIISYGFRGIIGICAWRSRGGKERGAQIDLLIDRDDRVINLCEMKFCEGAFAVDREYDERLRERRATFLRQTGTHKSVHLTLVTTVGLAETKYRGVFQSVVTLADLF